jgi:hypothetical protein
MKNKFLPLLLFTFAANAADLSTTFSSTYSKITVNNTITYTGSVVNKGVDTASNVQLLFYMPPKNVSIGNLPSGCWKANLKIICTIGELNVGDSASRTISVFYTKKGAAVATVNAITDSNDKNYSNNFTRLTTNITASTNTENSPLIPNVFSAKVTPSSIVQGNALTFNANLDAPLPSGYSVKVNYDGSNYAMNGSGTNYSLSNTPNTSGLKTFTTAIYDNYGSLKGSQMTGTFEVTKPNTAPTLSIVSGADTATTGTAYTLQLQANDADGNLSNIQITNWGDGSTDSQNATNNTRLSFSHTFGSAGSYTISATAYDDANASSSTTSKNVTVSNVVVTQPVTSTTGYTKIANNGSTLSDSAKLGTKDNNTGLIWEVKTDDGSLRDKDWYYSWYEPDATKNGGFEGYKNHYPNACKGSDCNTYAFTNAVNIQGLCGANNWRMPSIDELKGLVTTTNTINQPLNYKLYINATYFPNTRDFFWSSSPYASVSDIAWYVVFSNGNSYDHHKLSILSVRLVR